MQWYSNLVTQVSTQSLMNSIQSQTQSLCGLLGLCYFISSKFAEILLVKSSSINTWWNFEHFTSEILPCQRSVGLLATIVFMISWLRGLKWTLDLHIIPSCWTPFGKICSIWVLEFIENKSSFVKGNSQTYSFKS